MEAIDKVILQQFITRLSLMEGVNNITGSYGAGQRLTIMNLELPDLHEPAMNYS